MILNPLRLARQWPGRFWLLLLLLLLPGIGGLALWWNTPGPATIAPSPDKKGRWISAQWSTQDSALEFAATLAPAEVLPVVAPFDGTITELNVSLGDVVQRGQTLLTINSADMFARRNEAFANLTRNNHILHDLQHWSESLPMLQARQNVVRQSQALALSQQKQEQIEQLLTKGIASANELQEAEVELANAKDQLAVANAQYGQEMRKGSAEELAIARANQAAAKTSFEQLSARLARTRVLAAEAGILVKIANAKLLASGNKVSQDEPLLGIWSGQAWRVRAQIDQRDLALVRVGQRADITVEAIQARLDGRVIRVAREASQEGAGASTASVAKYDIEIELMPPPPEHLRPGMSAMVNLPLAKAEPALMVPIGALQKRQNPTGGPLQTVLWVKSAVPGNAGPSLRVVQTGQRSADAVQIVSGLAVGEMIWVMLE